MSDSTYVVPAPTQGRGWLVPAILAALAVAALAGAAVTGRWLLLVPVVLLAVAAGMMAWQARHARERARVVATLDDHGVELAQAGSAARYLRWDDVVGVRSDGQALEFHVRPDGERPRALGLSAGAGWDRFDEFATDVAHRLDASRGYTNRVCEFEALPSGGCSNALGCAGHATCQGHA